MKIVSKNLIPVLHFNPIYRDILAVMAAGLLVSLALVTIGFMVFH